MPCVGCFPHNLRWWGSKSCLLKCFPHTNWDIIENYKIVVVSQRSSIWMGDFCSFVLPALVSTGGSQRFLPSVVALLWGAAVLGSDCRRVQSDNERWNLRPDWCATYIIAVTQGSKYVMIVAKFFLSASFSQPSVATISMLGITMERQWWYSVL